MNLYPCLFLYLHDCFRGIQYGKIGGVIHTFEIECRFNSRGFMLYSINPYYVASFLQHLESVFEVFIHKAE